MARSQQEAGDMAYKVRKKVSPIDTFVSTISTAREKNNSEMQDTTYKVKKKLSSIESMGLDGVINTNIATNNFPIASILKNGNAELDIRSPTEKINRQVTFANNNTYIPPTRSCDEVE